MTELNPKIVKKKLIELYSSFLENPDNLGIKDSANKIYWDYQVGADHFLDKICSDAVWQAVYIKTGKMTPTKAKEILEDLRKS